MTSTKFAIAASVVFFFLSDTVGAPAEADRHSYDETAVTEFYQGKTVRIVVGFPPAAGYDISSRVVARHLTRYLPGKPSGIVVENRPGAGSLIAANMAFEVLPRDGTYIVSFHPQLLQQQVVGLEEIRFDGRAFNWLASMSSAEGACAVHRDTGVTHVKQLMGPEGRTVKMGGVAPGSGITDTAAVIRAALDLKFRIINGYPGQAAVAIAVERRELDGFCTTWASFTSVLRRFFEPEQLLNMVVITGEAVPDHPWLKGAVAAEAVAPNEKTRRMLRMANAPRRISYPFAMAPGVPPERVAALRTAFDRMLADPVFSAEYKKAGYEYMARSGEEVARIVNGLLSADPETVNLLREALK
jgi:tripartite-type tricarboxylate transporter receptor subunit TctC